MYSVVDLFAGAGGLSLGFKQTKQFDIKIAFENNPKAKKTYKRNYKDTEVFDDVCKADYDFIIKKYGQIDVVIGGPPCQGFSNANRQKNHAINQNNMLVKEYIRAITELNAKDIVCSEQLIKKYIWDKSDYLLLNTIYRQRNNIEKFEFSLSKHKKKLLDLSARLRKNNSFNNDEIYQINVEVSNVITSYFDNTILPNDIIKCLERVVMTQRMLSKAKEIFDNNIIVEEITTSGDIVAHINSFAVFDYIKCILSSEKYDYDLASDVLCAANFGVPQKRMRFVLIGIKKKINKAELPKGRLMEAEYNTVYDAIGDLSNVNPIYNVLEDNGIHLKKSKIKLSDLSKMLRDSKILYNHIITESRETALRRFAVIRQGENFHSLDPSMKEDTYTDISRTQNTIYLRLKYDEISGTVVNVRKSMWIHPEHNRAVSVREAARLQTFPDSFVFEGTKDSQYQQVGNAVPPVLAKAIAEKTIELLEGNKTQ
jgi:DNA (cytosine-5)-methyltransferase 1